MWKNYTWNPAICSCENGKYLASIMDDLFITRDGITLFHCEARTWYDDNIQSSAPYRCVLIKQLNYLAGLAKWLNACLWTKWLWVGMSLLSLKTSNIAPVLSKRLFDILATIECRFTLKRLREMIITYSRFQQIF